MGGFGLGLRTGRKGRRCLIVAKQVRPALGSSGHDLEGVVASGLVAGTYLTIGTIRRRMTWPRRLRLGHCTAFPVDSTRSAVLHFRKARFFSGRHTEGFGTNEPGDSVLGADSRPGGTDRSGRGPATRPTLFGRGSSLCEDFPGLRRVRTSPRCSLGNANTDATKRYVYGINRQNTNFFFFF